MGSPWPAAGSRNIAWEESVFDALRMSLTDREDAQPLSDGLQENWLLKKFCMVWCVPVDRNP